MKMYINEPSPTYNQFYSSVIPETELSVTYYSHSFYQKEINEAAGTQKAALLNNYSYMAIY